MNRNLKDEASKAYPLGDVWRGILEVIGFTIKGCSIAQSAGASRIELCDNPVDGGTTASHGFIKAARKNLHIELFPIIRPRGGDFFYNDDEFEIMKTDIRLCKELRCDGVVIGMLTNEGKIDKKKCGMLVELAYPLSVTLHRAFDRTVDPFEALEDIIEIGCERVLTSGQKVNAVEGAPLIKQLIEQAEDRIIIMPGSGVRANNIVDVAEITGATEFHSSARIQSGENISVDGEEIKKMLVLLKNISENISSNKN